MKKYLIITLAILMGFACSDDFLEKTPYTDKVEENFYQTPQDAFEGLVATYDILQRTGWGNFLLVSEVVSDNCFGGGGKSDDFGALWLDRFQADGYDLHRTLWRDNYIGIFRANKLISKLGEVAWGSGENLRTRYEAEARFLRAYYYFELVRYYENIPLITVPLRADELNQPQAAPEATYAQIAEDLKFAIENLPDVPYGDIPASEYGRATRWAAETLMGRVFLFYTDYYEQASIGEVVSRQDVIGYIDDVIENSGHDLVPDYNALWLASAASSAATYAGENNIETIFAVKYSHQGLRNWDLNEGSRWQVLIALRAQRIPPYGYGWGFATVNEEYWNAFDPADTRRGATIISIADEGLAFDDSDQRQYTGYTWKKYMPLSLNGTLNESEVLGGDFQIDNYEDYAALRFSDALLMGAELNLDANAGKAQAYYDRVRERAFGDGTHNLPATKANILEERRLEFGLEGHRYWDLIRQDMAIAGEALDHDGAGEDLDVTFRPETRGFLKIPESQIELSNGLLTQNDGWN